MPLKAVRLRDIRFCTAHGHEDDLVAAPYALCKPLTLLLKPLLQSSLTQLLPNCTMHDDVVQHMISDE